MLLKTEAFLTNNRVEIGMLFSIIKIIKWKLIIQEF
jgi:hypothetical protein